MLVIELLQTKHTPLISCNTRRVRFLNKQVIDNNWELTAAAYAASSPDKSNEMNKSYWG